MRDLLSATEPAESKNNDSTFASSESVSSPETHNLNTENAGSLPEQDSALPAQNTKKTEVLVETIKVRSTPGDAMNSWRNFKEKYFDERSFIEPDAP